MHIVTKPIIDLGKAANHRIRTVASPVSACFRWASEDFQLPPEVEVSVHVDTKCCEFSARTPAIKFAGLLKISSNFHDRNFVPFIFKEKGRAENTSCSFESPWVSLPGCPPWVLLDAGATAFVAELSAGRGSLDQQGELQVLLGWVGSHDLGIKKRFSIRLYTVLFNTFALFMLPVTTRCMSHIWRGAACPACACADAKCG